VNNKKSTITSLTSTTNGPNHLTKPEKGKKKSFVKHLLFFETDALGFAHSLKRVEVLIESE
jgi:hypothetical protein